MTSYIDPAFRESLLKKPHDRTAQDLTLINANLKSLEALSSLRDTTIRSLCKTVRYEKHEANDVLYRSDDVINCWYILLSGSVFIDGSMFLPRSGFGRRSVGQSRRIHDCLVLETSEMIVIDYPHLKQQQQEIQINNKTTTKSNNGTELIVSNNNNNTATSSSSSISSTSNKHKLTEQLLLDDSSITPTSSTATTGGGGITDNTYSFSPLHSSMASSSSNTISIVSTTTTTKKKKHKKSYNLDNDDANNNENDDDQHQINDLSNKKHVSVINNISINSSSSSSSFSNGSNKHNHHTTSKQHHKHQSQQITNTSINSLNSEISLLNVNNNNHHQNNNNNITSTTDDVSSTSDLQQSIQNMISTKDIVRDVLEKDPKERTDEDIDILFEFMQSFPAFSDLRPYIIRKLCACMVLGVVDKADTLVLDNHEKLDSWAVVLNGCVECTLYSTSDSDSNSTTTTNIITKLYNIGDHFGVTPTLDAVYHEGVMRTKCDDCQFVLVKQNDYYEILNKSKENINTHTENGKPVLITEHRCINESTEKTSEIVLKGSVDKLVERLVYDDSYSIIDPTYIQDFLLTYRVFCENPMFISNKLIEWFQLNKSYLNSPTNRLTTTNNSNNNNNSNNTNNIKKKVYRIVLEWITNHFNDFETNKELYEFVERFQEQLNREKMFEQLRVLTIAISTKSKPRTVTLARSKRDESLMFQIQGGWEKGYGIFVSKVLDQKAYTELNIRKGDQIMDVNGHSFQHIHLSQAMDTLKQLTHLSITLKYNPIGYNEILLHPEKSPHRSKKNPINNDKQYLIKYLQMQQNQFQQSLNNSIDSTDNNNSDNNNKQQQQQQGIGKKSIGAVPPLPPVAPSSNGISAGSTSPKQQNKVLQSATNSSNQIRKIFGKFKGKAHSKDLESLQTIDSSAPSLKSITRSPSPSLSTFTSNSNHLFNRSTTITSINSHDGGVCINHQNPFQSNSTTNLIRNSSLTNLNSNNNNNNNNNNESGSLASISLQEQQQFAGEHVLKIFKNDQTFKYLVVHKETSTKEVVMLALNEFNIVEKQGSNAYSLCEVSVDQDKLIKQKRLPDQMNNLAEKLALNARYYLKSNVSPEQFLSDSLSVDELIKDATITFLQLDPLELSAQLTLRDYCIFKSIESSEYIDYFFKKTNSKYGYSHLTHFSDLSNEEMFWVINEILHESNLVKRARIIKLFIQIAHICKECKNFNSLLAILSGLDHLTVTRLKETWEKVPNKYKKILEDLRILLDTSRNMLKYRQLLKSEYIQPPIIPFFPICQKDLYFIKESGETKEDGLINFDKLRKFSKGVRSIVQMTSSSFDLTSLKDVPTSHSVIFTMFGCTNPQLIESTFKQNGVGYQFTTKLNGKADHVKKLYEESVMVRKVRHYLNGLSKNIEKNEERLRNISSALEHSVSVNTTLRRKPSPNNSLAGSVSSINGLNNSSNMHNISNASSIGGNGNGTIAGISSGNGVLNNSSGNGKLNASSALFGTHSPDAVKKLLSLSETKVIKQAKSSSSASMPISHLSNSRLVMNTSGGSGINSSSSNSSNASGSTLTTTINNDNNILSPRSKNRQISSSQPINHHHHHHNNHHNNNNNNQSSKYSNSIHLSSESSSVSTIKLSGKYIMDSYSAATMSYQPNIHNSSSNNNNNKSKSIINVVNGSEADSGRASMASNIDQEQCSPTFQQRAFTINRYTDLTNNNKATTYQISNQPKSPNLNQYILKQQQQQQHHVNYINNNNNNNLLNPQNSLEEEEDQVSAV